MNGAELLDLLKERTGITTDMALAERLGVTRATTSLIRKNECGIGPDLARKMAVILKVNPLKIQGWSHAWMSKNDRDRSYWLKKAAAAIVLLALVQVGAQVQFSAEHFIHYAQLSLGCVAVLLLIASYSRTRADIEAQHKECAYDF